VEVNEITRIFYLRRRKRRFATHRFVAQATAQCAKRQNVSTADPTQLRYRRWRKL
jgi:hypothetical protein